MSSLIKMIVLSYSACFAVHPDSADVDESYKRYESGGLGISTALCISSICVLIKPTVNAGRDTSIAIHNFFSFIDFD